MADDGLADAPDLDSWTCPLPLRDHDRVVMGHGGGGRLSAELVENIFVPAFGQPDEPLRDSAIIEPELLAGGRLAFSTDSYVVRPLFFPGGCIGDLAVNGTINDLAMSGARPTALSCGAIIEEGLPMSTLGRVAQAMGAAAAAAGVPIVTGDTKVVDGGEGGGLYLNTAGVGVVPEGVELDPRRASPGDVVVLSGPIGQHGIAVMSQREGLDFGTGLETDSAPLHELVPAMLDAAPGAVHVLRDPTRGGVAASLCEIAAAGGVGVVYDEASVPVPEEVAAACSFLGLDPMTIANEGRLVAFVAPDGVDAVVAAMQRRHEGSGACVIGTVTDEHPGVVVARTPFGASRVVDLPLGEVLPRIC